MKNIIKFLGIIALVAVIGFSIIACDNGSGGGGTHTHSYSTAWSSDATQHWRECTANDGAKSDVANHTGDPCTVCGYSSTATTVTFSGLTANGNATATTTTTALTLTFSQAITGLSANDITLSGASVTKGTLSGSGPTYTLGISGVTAGGTLTVAVSKMGYNISGSPKSTTIYYYASQGGGTPPSGANKNEAIPLTANLWANGSLTSGSQQWFTFTATASTQYIHFAGGTLSSTSGIYMQVYTNSSVEAGDETRLYSSTTYTSRVLTAGQTYYIRVRPYDNNSGGTYRIGFNTLSYYAPITLPSNPIQLTENQWADGESPYSSSEQWFTFTATALRQYIHFEPDSLTQNTLVQRLYTSSGASVSSTSLLTTGQTYYIRVMREIGSYGNVTYRIAFNASFYPPDTTFIPLTENQWTDGDLPTRYDVQWFTFTATEDTQYIHVDFGTLNSSNGVSVRVYTSSGIAVGSGVHFFDFTTHGSNSLSVASGQTYYIRVESDDGSYGTYRIGFNAFIAPPDTIPLTENQWTDGDLPKRYDEQWFSFSATASTQYIHFKVGTLTGTGLVARVYDSSSASVSGTTPLTGLTVGETYYINVGSHDSASTASGTYRIGFNTSTTAPTQ